MQFDNVGPGAGELLNHISTAAVDGDNDTITYT